MAAGKVKGGSSTRAVDLGVPRNRSSKKQSLIALHARLQERRGEIEEALLTRVYGVSDPAGTAAPEYLSGLRGAVATALDYGLDAIERGDGSALPVPAELLVQARVAARNNINLDTVLRRYFAGYTLLGDYVMGVAEEDDLLGPRALQELLRSQANLLDRIVTAVTEEYTRESESLLSSGEARRADRVRKLLSGEPLDTSELSYDFAAWHIGALAAGKGAVEGIRELATSLDCRLLFVCDGEGPVWAWFGGRNRLEPDQLKPIVSSNWPQQVALAIGEPGHGLAGWRLSHRQARAALPVALRSAERPVQYADVALVASLLQDDLLTASLRQLYLAPLTAERDGGEMMRETLRAYFSSGRNVSSAAASLGVSRRTVTNRLHSIEARLGRPLDAACSEIEVALRLEDLEVQKGLSRDD